MNTGKMSLAILVTALALLLSACSTPAPVVPTAAPASPTSTPNPTPTAAPPTAVVPTAAPASPTSTPNPTPTPAPPTAVAPTATSPTSTPNPTRTPAPPAATPKSATGRIEGKVQRSDTNQPIVSATLYLCCESNTKFPEGIVAKAITDAQGNYNFDRVSPGQYFILLGLRGLPEYGPPQYADYPFCSDGIPEGWQALINTGFEENPIQLLPPNMEFSIAAGDVFQKDIDMKDIKCK